MRRWMAFASQAALLAGCASEVNDGSDESPERGAPPEVELVVGQLIRLVAVDDAEGAEEVLGVVGQIPGCWAAFYLGEPSDPPRRFVVVGAERFEGAEVFVTPGVVSDREGLLLHDASERYQWVRLDGEVVEEGFVACAP